MTSAIFYASKGGNTQEVAKKISLALDEIRTYNITVTGAEYMPDYRHLIFGISTWENGEMQKEWKKIWDEFSHIDFSNKTVAIFGLGDQKKYPDEFANAMRYIYDNLIEHGANIIGLTSINGYKFNSSKAVINNDKFVGLVLDIENQNELTDERIKNWTDEIRKDIL